MVTIEYCEEGRCVSDFYTEEFQLLVRNCIKSGKQIHLKISSGIGIDAVRVLIVKGYIKHTDVQFLFKDELFSTNHYGRIENWPRGFAEKHVELCDELLTEAISIRKKERRND